MKRSPLPLASLVALSFASSLATGCLFWTEPDIEPIAVPPASTRLPPRTTPTAPHIEGVELPAWPPLGRDGQVRVTVRDDVAVTRLEARFRSYTSVAVSGTRAVATIPAEALGEGFGRLDLAVWNSRAGRAERSVDDFLVDLTPPEIDLERAVVSPNANGLESEVAVWVSDEFVLGSVELTFGGKSLSHEFPHVYPPTLGKEWDVSRVAFPAKDLPERDGKAVIVARDAAGNATSRELSLRIDATPPTVAITSPLPGAVVSGPFDVVSSGSDPGSSVPVALEVYVGGSPVASLLGPSARLRIDPATLSKGPLEIRVVARDEAGNTSLTEAVVVTHE